MNICIDSQPFIWGIKKQATDGQEEMIARAEQFFNWVDANGHTIILPTIVIAEVLAREPLEVHAHYMEIIQKNFIVASVDGIVALKYAQILNNRIEELKELANQEKIRRDKMKFDHLIIACALINNASCIYSYDVGLKKFANNLIDVREFPPLVLKVKQTDLFDEIAAMQEEKVVKATNVTDEEAPF